MELMEELIELMEELLELMEELIFNGRINGRIINGIERSTP